MEISKLPDGTPDWCSVCKNKGEDEFDFCFECEYQKNENGEYDESLPPSLYQSIIKTNGDSIRAMSDEELANAKILCPYTAVHMDMCEKWIVSGDTRDCAACALDWLKKEVSDD